MHAFALATEFSKRGCYVTVVTAGREDFQYEEFDNNLPFRVYRYPANSVFLIKFLFYLKIFWQFRNERPYFLLSGSAQQLLNLFAGCFNKAQVMHVIHGHEILMARGIRKKLLKISLNRGNHVVAVSEFAKEILLKNGITVSVSVIPNGVYMKEGLAENPCDLTPLRLITVGSVTPRKGQINVVCALSLIKQVVGPVEYHVVGMPVNRSLLIKTANDLGVSHEVFIHGVLSDTQRDELLRRSHIFMMLSENLPNGDVEGFGIAILEANALGIPAIGSRGTGIEQAIKHEVTGLLVNPREPVEVADAIKEILNRYSEFSLNCKKWASEHSWSLIAEHYWRLLS